MVGLKQSRVATGVRADGNREVLGLDVGDSKHSAFWTAFLRSLKALGPQGGAAGHLRRSRRTKQCIAAAFVGAALQRR